MKFQNLEEIEATQWAKNFKSIDPGEYDRALEFAEALNRGDKKVNIVHSDETGEWQWAISIGEESFWSDGSRRDSSWDDGFWLDAFSTKKEALELCKKMGWKINT